MVETASIQVESYEFSLRDIRAADVTQLHALSISVGWPHRLEDWEMLRAVGQGVVAQDGIGRILGSGMWFPMGNDFATIGMVITSPRLQTQGTGRWLMAHILGQTDNRRLGLNATRAARRLYRSLGFTVESTVYQCQGEVRDPGRTDGETKIGRVRPFQAEDLPGILALDRRAFGADRATYLQHVLSDSRAVCLIRNGRVEAFAGSRRFGRGQIVGPVIASNDEEAIAVTHPLIASHQGQFLRLDTRRKAGAFRNFLEARGLTLFDTVTTMSRPLPWLPSHEENAYIPDIYGLISQALG